MQAGQNSLPPALTCRFQSYAARRDGGQSLQGYRKLMQARKRHLASKDKI